MANAKNKIVRKDYLKILMAYVKNAHHTVMNANHKSIAMSALMDLSYKLFLLSPKRFLTVKKCVVMEKDFS